MIHVTKINLRHYLYCTFSLIVLKPFFFIIQYVIEKKKGNRNYRAGTKILRCYHFLGSHVFKKIHTLI